MQGYSTHRRYLSRPHATFVRPALVSLTGLFAMSMGSTYLIREVIKRYLDGTLNLGLEADPITGWGTLFIVLVCSCPIMLFIMTAPQSIPGAFAIILESDMVHVRRLFGVRHIPRKAIKFVGVRQKGRWLVRIFPFLGSPSNFRADGRPPIAHYLEIDYEVDQPRSAPKKRTVSLPIFFSEKVISDIQVWLIRGYVNTAP